MPAYADKFPCNKLHARNSRRRETYILSEHRCSRCSFSRKYIVVSGYAANIAINRDKSHEDGNTEALIKRNTDRARIPARDPNEIARCCSERIERAASSRFVMVHVGKFAFTLPV